MENKNILTSVDAVVNFFTNQSCHFSMTIRDLIVSVFKLTEIERFPNVNIIVPNELTGYIFSAFGIIPQTEFVDDFGINGIVFDGFSFELQSGYTKEYDIWIGRDMAFGHSNGDYEYNRGIQVNPTFNMKGNSYTPIYEDCIVFAHSNISEELYTMLTKPRTRNKVISFDICN